MGTDAEVEDLYRRLMTCWNTRDAGAYGALFTADGSLVGFDGSSVKAAEAVTEHLRGIFGDHETATYVWIVREVRPLADGVALLRADVGMVPPGGDDINPGANAVQSLVARRTRDGWRVAHFHNTPAAFHGRPDDAEALTAELRRALAAA